MSQRSIEVIGKFPFHNSSETSKAWLLKVWFVRGVLNQRSLVILRYQNGTVVIYKSVLQKENLSNPSPFSPFEVWRLTTSYPCHKSECMKTLETCVLPDQWVKSYDYINTYMSFSESTKFEVCKKFGETTRSHRYIISVTLVRFPCGTKVTTSKNENFRS